MVEFLCLRGCEVFGKTAPSSRGSNADGFIASEMPGGWIEPGLTLAAPGAYPMPLHAGPEGARFSGPAG